MLLRPLKTFRSHSHTHSRSSEIGRFRFLFRFRIQSVAEALAAWKPKGKHGHHSTQLNSTRIGLDWIESDVLDFGIGG